VGDLWVPLTQVELSLSSESEWLGKERLRFSSWYPSIASCCFKRDFWNGRKKRRGAYAFAWQPRHPGADPVWTLASTAFSS